MVRILPKEVRRISDVWRIAVGSMCACAILSVNGQAVSKQTGQTFDSPDAAMNAFVGAARAMDPLALERIFGSDAHDLLFSGDEIADKNALSRMAQAVGEGARLERRDDTEMVLIFGSKKWPFPVPLMKQGEAWIFDIERGREEVLNRRIGENEIKAIRACRGIFQAQKLYALKDRDGDGWTEYAQLFRSSPGRKNGLFWPVTEGEEPSPLGPIVAEAAGEGYGMRKSDSPAPYYGYYFRILTRQGRHAPGGAQSFITEGGRMTKGFAVVAWPATWGVSGIMTFTVSHDGRVLEKNLGPRTGSIASAMQEYDPDSGWEAVTG